MNKLYVTLMSCLILSNISTLAKADRAGGGGDGFTSTVEQVRKEVNNLSDPLTGLEEVYSKAFLSHRLDPKNVDDQDVKAVLNAFGPHNLLSGLYTEIKNSKYMPQSACYDTLEKKSMFSKGELKDASTPYQKFGDICFNENTLTRYPKEELKLEVVALAFHEIAHHYNFNETVAHKFQIYMKRIAKTILDDIETSAAPNGYVFVNSGGKAEVEGTQGMSFEVFCEPVAKIKTITSIGSNVLPNNAILIHPGSKLMVQGAHQPVGVQCEDVPKAECRVDGSAVLDEDRALSLMDPHPYETLKKWQESGLCR